MLSYQGIQRSALKIKDNKKYSMWARPRAWGTGLLVLGILTLLSFTVGPSAPKSVSAAGTAKFSLSPASGSFKKGASFSVTIYETSSDPVNAVEADLIYDQSKLQFNSIDTSHSAFDIGAVSSGGSGSVKIARANTTSSSGLTGSQVVASVKFTALVGSGTTSITFDGRCLKNSSGQATTGCSRIVTKTTPPQDVWDGNTTGGTYTLTGTTTTPTTTKKTTTGGTTTTTTQTTTPTKTSTSTSTKAKTPAKKTSTQVASLTSQNGYLVAIKVIDNSHKPVQNAQVTLDAKAPLSYDSTGTASYVDIKAGLHTVVVKAKDKQATKVITVVDGSLTAVQEFKVQLNIGTSTLVKVLIGVAAVVVIIIIIGGGSGLFNSIRRGGVSKDLASHFPKTSPADQAGPLPVKEAPKTPTGAVSAGAGTGGQIIHPDLKANNITNNSNLLDGQKGK